MVVQTQKVISLWGKFIQFLVLHIHVFILHFLNINDLWKETLDKRKKENEEKEKCQERKIKKENVNVDFHLSFMSICSINPLFDYY